MKPLNSRQIGWANFLVDYKFVIGYRPARQNKKADLLSRMADLLPPKQRGEPSMLRKPGLFFAASQIDLDIETSAGMQFMTNQMHQKPLCGWSWVKSSMVRPGITGFCMFNN
jgi:hypothetical protein